MVWLLLLRSWGNVSLLIKYRLKSEYLIFVYSEYIKKLDIHQICKSYRLAFSHIVL